MKIAIAGKGGVGKTTLTSLLACHYARSGRPVLAVDADPSPCLGPALGFPPGALLDLRPIADLQDLIAERTGAAAPQAAGAFFRLNPRVGDLPERFSRAHDGIRLLLLGAVREGGAGCICPASALLRELVRHAVVRRGEVVLLDLYAGVEHLGRGTAAAVDAMVVVAEPTDRALRSARQIRSLAADIGVRNLFLVGNKVRGRADVGFILENGPDVPLAGVLPLSPEAMAAERAGQVLYDVVPGLAKAIPAIVRRLEGGPPDPAQEARPCASTAAATSSEP